jgi:hypothetical protein
MRIIRIAVILMAVVCLPLFAHTAEIQMTSSTQYLWYQDFLSDDEDQNEIAEYLRLNATKLDKDGKISIYGYGRVIHQFSDSFEVRPEIANDTFGRMYYLYLDYRDAIKDHLDVRAGRTYVSAAAVAGTVDGAYLDVKNLGPMGITLFGGRRVIFDNKSEIGTSGDSLAGGSVYLDTIKFTHVEVSYGRKYADTDLATENVGLDFSTTPHEKVNVYGRMKYDIVSSRFNEVLLGAKVAPLKDLILRGEYYYSYATFDKSSFYRFFDINNYKEIGIAAEYQVNVDYRIYAKYAHEDFGGDETANLYDLGFFARPIKDLTLDASYEYRQGFTGKLNGFRFHGAYKIYRAMILAGIDYDDFRREDSREGTAKKYWAGLNYEINKRFSAVLRLEDNTNFLFDDSFQGFVALTINL